MNFALQDAWNESCTVHAGVGGPGALRGWEGGGLAIPQEAWQGPSRSEALLYIAARNENPTAKSSNEILAVLE